MNRQRRLLPKRVVGKTVSCEQGVINKSRGGGYDFKRLRVQGIFFTVSETNIGNTLYAVSLCNTIQPFYKSIKLHEGGYTK